MHAKYNHTYNIKYITYLELRWWCHCNWL